MKAGMSNLERLVVGGVEEGMLEHGMPQDAAGRIGAFGFLIAYPPSYFELQVDHMQ